MSTRPKRLDKFKQTISITLNRRILVDAQIMGALEYYMDKMPNTSATDLLRTWAHKTILTDPNLTEVNMDSVDYMSEIRKTKNPKAAKVAGAKKVKSEVNVAEPIQAVVTKPVVALVKEQVVVPAESAPVDQPVLSTSSVQPPDDEVQQSDDEDRRSDLLGSLSALKNFKKIGI